MSTLKLGIVGAGFVAHFHARALTQVRNIEVAGISSLKNAESLSGFVKSNHLGEGVIYPDAGCNAETYCNDRFVELESLGPLAPIDPGESTKLSETWELYPGLNVPFIPEEIRGLLGKKN